MDTERVHAAILILGTLYVRPKNNLLACMLLHALVNSSPAMQMIKFGSAN